MQWCKPCALLALTLAALWVVPAGPALADQGPVIAGEIDIPVIETLELDVERYHRMTVPVTIMGQGPFDFMVDTGSQATVLSTELADRLELFDRAGALLIGMASARQVQTAFIPDFGIGGRNIAIRSAPLIEGEHIGGADGILGLDSLQDQRVLLDFRTGQMHISDSFDAGGVNGYDIVVRARARLGQLIIHRAEIDGISVDVIVDTGAQGSIGNLALQDRMRRRAVLEEATMTDVNGVAIIGPTRVARLLEIGNARIGNVQVTFADSPTFRHLDLVDRPAMILGMSELRVFERVAIDFRSSRVLFDLPPGVPIDQSWNFGARATRLGQ